MFKAYGPLTRCIAYAQLGETFKAKKELKEVIKRIPDIEKIAKNYFFVYLVTRKLPKRYVKALR